MLRKSDRTAASEPPVTRDAVDDKVVPEEPSATGKRTRAFRKALIYTTLIVALLAVLIFDEQRIEMLKLEYKLKWGAPPQKDAVLDFFMAEHPRVGPGRHQCHPR